MTDPIKAIAEVLLKHDGLFPTTWDNASEAMRVDAMTKARAVLLAALAAVRDPSDRMIEEGTSIIRFAQAVGAPDIRTTTAAWQGMVDAFKQEHLPEDRS